MLLSSTRHIKFSAFLKTIHIHLTEFAKNDTYKARMMAYYEWYVKSNTKENKNIFELSYHDYFYKKKNDATYEELEEQVSHFIKFT